MSTASAANYRNRLRANAAMALAEGATVTEVLADVVAISRRNGPPDADELRVAGVLVDTLHRELAAGGDLHG